MFTLEPPPTVLRDELGLPYPRAWTVADVIVGIVALRPVTSRRSIG